MQNSQLEEDLDEDMGFCLYDDDSAPSITEKFSAKKQEKFDFLKMDFATLSPPPPPPAPQLQPAAITQTSIDVPSYSPSSACSFAESKMNFTPILPKPMLPPSQTSLFSQSIPNIPNSTGSFGFNNQMTTNEFNCYLPSLQSKQPAGLAHTSVPNSTGSFGFNFGMEKSTALFGAPISKSSFGGSNLIIKPQSLFSERGNNENLLFNQSSSNSTIGGLFDEDVYSDQRVEACSVRQSDSMREKKSLKKKVSVNENINNINNNNNSSIELKKKKLNLIQMLKLKNFFEQI